MNTVALAISLSWGKRGFRLFQLKHLHVHWHRRSAFPLEKHLETTLLLRNETRAPCVHVNIHNYFAYGPAVCVSAMCTKTKEFLPFVEYSACALMDKTLQCMVSLSYCTEFREQYIILSADIADSIEVQYRMLGYEDILLRSRYVLVQSSIV